MSRIRVAHFEDPVQAEALRQRLTQAGISATIHNRYGVARLWYVSTRRGGFRLEVPAKDAEQARGLLLTWNLQHECLQGAVHCPECGSLRVDYPQFTSKSVFTNLAMGLMAEVGLVEREYYCEDCHCMWAKPGTKPRPVRGHLAPDYFLEGLQHGPSPEEEHLRKPGGGAAQQNERSVSQHSSKFKRLGSGRAARGIILFLANCAGVCAAQIQAQSTSPQTPSVNAAKPTYLRDVLPILMGKCTRCHNDQNHVMQNWLDYRTASAQRWEIKRRVWDSWNGAYFKQPMPTDNSPEHEAITDAERTVIRDWVESGAVRGVRPIFKSAQSKVERMEQGKHLFASICAACHQPTGQGIPGRFPPLAGSDLLNSDKHRAIKIVVNGLQGEVTVNGQKFNSTMPKFPLSDEEIACALTYVYSSFGNSGKDVTPLEVSSVRSEQNDLNVGTKPTEEKSPYE